MILMMLLLTGDFTYTAPAGTWLDYARSTALSEDRFLIVEQVGQKGEYGQGARQKIMDGDGTFLYDIPPAENAWVLLNGFLGDPDTYIFQTREDKGWMIWHPVFGVRALSCGTASDSDHLLPFETPYISFFKMVKQGKRLVFISKPPHQTEQGLTLKTKIEILEFKGEPDDFFEGAVARPDSYSRIQLDQDLSYTFDGYTMALYDPIEGMKGLALFFEMDLTDDVNRMPLIERKTSRPIHAMSLEKGYLAYSTREGMVFEKVGATRPLFVLEDADREQPDYQHLRAFLNMFGTGVIAEDQGRLSYIKNKQLTIFDTKQLTLQRFQLSNTFGGPLSPDRRYETKCDHQTFTVKPIEEGLLRNRSTPMPTVSAKAFAP